MYVYNLIFLSCYFSDFINYIHDIHVRLLYSYFIYKQAILIKERQNWSYAHLMFMLKSGIWPILGLMLAILAYCFIVLFHWFC